MSAVQFPAPVPAVVEQQLVCLAYTRQRGWTVVKRSVRPDRIQEWLVRPGGARIMEYEVLAWADLPPVPESAA